ncbi:MAG TPA: aminotransferase class I/II-fold pyridoxal phosphate-dependent enzyme [bacterium]|nr:aminotransferase class I/II-fold pyridoxal phosphate-dependent enzyme [bacterium]HPQ66802.1 aminotransferase class I/II-fold pyridoxal phosphate-dependent enzyme [bacterium]
MKKKIKPASRTRNVSYAVRDVIVIADQAAASGMEMTYLNIGDPNKFDYRTPDHIVEAAFRAARGNFNSYAPSSGIPEALEAIERDLADKRIPAPLYTFIGTGATEVIDISLTSLVEEGENVLVPCPGYPTYSAILAKLKAESRPYYLDEEKEWQPDIEEIRGLIDAKTRAIILINPNNPTGGYYGKEIVQGLADLAEEFGIVLFSDEIYDRLLLNDRPFVSPAALNPRAPVITINGLSKNYLAPGWRLGWGAFTGPGDLMEEYIEAVQKLVRARLCANHPEQWAIPAALGEGQEHLHEVRAKLVARRDLAMDILNACPGISCVRPEGAFYAFPRIEIEGSDREFVTGLIRKTGVVVVPGSGFGQAPGTNHFRLVFLAPEDILGPACEKIVRFYRGYPGARPPA